MKPPVVTITERALRAFRAAESDAGAGEGEVLRLVIDASFQNDLYFSAPEPNDVVVVVDGLRLAMDARTARRADGLSIDFVEGASGTGFKLDNPNASSAIQGIRPADVVHLLEAGEVFHFIDARSDEERKKARLDAARPLDAAYEAELAAAPADVKLIVLGHHSTQGRAAARPFSDRGFKNVWYVVGGIDAWSTMDPSVPRY